MVLRSGWLRNRDTPGGGQTRQDTRVTPVGTYTPSGQLSSRGGCLPSSGSFILTGTTPMQATIGYGRAVIMGSGASQGAYPVAIDSIETLTFADGHAQYPRIDSVLLRVYDNAFDASGKWQFSLEISQGEPSASPVAPVATGTAEKLYEVTVPAGASAGSGGISWATAVADRRRYTVSIGGITPSGWGSNWTGQYAGQYRDNAGVMERWGGATAGWVPISDAGAMGAWIDYTPTWSVEAMNYATSTGSYRKVGRTVDVVASLRYGPASYIGVGHLFVSLPFAVAPTQRAILSSGTGFFQIDPNTPLRPLFTSVAPGGNAAMVLAVHPPSSTLVAPGTLDFPWERSSNNFSVSLRYETGA